MNNKIGGSLLVAWLMVGSVWAQPAKTVSEESQVWLGYAGQIWVTPKIGVWLDAGTRWVKLVDEWNTYLVRPGITYRISEHVALTAGYAWFGQRIPNPDHLAIRPEHRPWQQLNWTQTNKKVQLIHRIRTEQRFIHRTDKGELAKGYRFNHRLRYQLGFNIALRDSTRKPLTLIGSDEILINAGKQITYNYFDQNRLFLGLGYQLSKPLQIQFGYMYVFQQLAAGNQYTHSHVLRLSLVHHVKVSDED